MKATKKERIEKNLSQQFNTANYDSLHIGDYLSNAYGTFCLISKPNLWQPIEDRKWIFEQTEDETGEPFTSGPRYIIES